jgi:preprotein translocase subunit SecY
MPYVTASIIVQLLTVVIPKLEQLQKEGEAGYARINQYTRYLTIGLAAAQATGYAFLFKRQAALPNVNAGRLVIIILTLTAGCALLMWMGEQITKRGVGNGISLLIFASILAYASMRLDQRRHDGTALLPDHRARRRQPVVYVQRVSAGFRCSTARRQLGNRQTTGGSIHARAREHGRS